MKSRESLIRLPVRSRASTLALSLSAVGLFAACGGEVDARFAPESYDERTEPLTNAIVGTPDGSVTVTGPNGAVVSTSTGAGGSGSTGPERDDVVVIGTGGGGGRAGSGGAGGGGGLGPVDDGSGFGLWHFDDCSPASHFLADSSGFGTSAQHELGAECVTGISDQGVEIRSPQDVIQIPDQPQFTVRSRVAVAAWVNPRTVEGDQPIVIKRLSRQTSFSLGIHSGNIEMSVVLSDGTTVISRAPIEAGVFTHVAGMFDGTFLFLFINGQQFGQIYAAGNLRNVFAPIRVGATSQSQYFDGTIDEVFVSTQAISKEELIALACIPHPTTFSVYPETSGPVPPDTTVEYTVTVENNDVGACAPRQFNAFINSFEPGINAFFDDSFQEIPAGSSGQFTASVTGTEDAQPGVHEVAFQLFDFGAEFETFDGQFVYELTPPTGCFVSTRRELMITALSVVDDPIRTAGNGAPPIGGGPIGGGPIPLPPVFGGPSSGAVPVGNPVPVSRPVPVSASEPPLPGADPSEPAPDPAPAAPVSTSAGVWSFGHLMRELAPTPEDAPRMVEEMLKTYTTTQVVNGFAVAPRPGMQSLILDFWPRTAEGQLDLDHAPVTLQAIVNRLDIRDLSLGSGGEGRFVFGVNDPSGFPLQFTMIFEYNLPANSEQDVLDWANLWHGLQAHELGTEAYNAALEGVTRRFSSRDASPGSVNGSALFSFRTNEIDLGSGAPWEFRQFDLSPVTGFFRQVPLSETPDLGFNGSQTFADFVNENAGDIIASLPGGLGTTVPLAFQGRPFQAATVFNNLEFWSAPGLVDSEARFHASLNTCNGCHGPEAGSGFLQISPRFPGDGTEAFLAPFLTGTTVFDPFTGESRRLNDLARRKEDLLGLVCAGEGNTPPVLTPPPVAQPPVQQPPGQRPPQPGQPQPVQPQPAPPPAALPPRR